MTLVQLFHPEAELELKAAVDRYDYQQPGLGENLVELTEEAIGLILEWPLIAPVFPGWDREPTLRTQAVSRFPYRVIYYLTDTDLTIVAIAHNRRKPGYWKDRL